MEGYCKMCPVCNGRVQKPDSGTGSGKVQRIRPYGITTSGKKFASLWIRSLSEEKSVLGRNCLAEVFWPGVCRTGRSGEYALRRKIQ